ncbi:MAG: PAP/fibrillin family protein [Sphingomonadaceae bacterium]|uniref:PAP/fibrillin family protein n=1 Tax=Thermaurantiacus sp. TaxID=2820283 RepID=UPI00298EF9B5|nr:PAP/fibrillin family protein [Thermaurantiacus sp.]MCS6987575.1 PAP/fibrillin family protein [Sphingomonadaceae bacterium]MDW8415176.1 PAP/fibrillin family protein [Thermaurantiacus sp.]
MGDPQALKAELAALAAASEGFSDRDPRAPQLDALAKALEAHNPTAEPARAHHLLGGRWALLWSSFGLPRHTTLARLTFNVLPKAPVEVEALFQEVDPTTGLYDNVVTYRCQETGRAGTCVTLGRYGPHDGTRLDVTFTHAQATGHPRQPIRTDRLPPLWSDVTYLDADFRLNRGSFGSLYVLRLVERRPAAWARDG